MLRISDIIDSVVSNNADIIFDYRDEHFHLSACASERKVHLFGPYNGPYNNEYVDQDTDVILDTLIVGGKPLREMLPYVDLHVSQYTTMQLTDEHMAKIRELFPDDADRLLAFEDVNQLLDFLDLKTYLLLDDRDEPTDESRVVERLRDNIYWYNTHKIYEIYG